MKHGPVAYQGRHDVNLLRRICESLKMVWVQPCTRPGFINTIAALIEHHEELPEILPLLVKCRDLCRGALFSALAADSTRPS
jgi:hypothetical protein